MLASSYFITMKNSALLSDFNVKIILVIYLSGFFHIDESLGYFTIRDLSNIFLLVDYCDYCIWDSSALELSIKDIAFVLSINYCVSI